MSMQDPEAKTYPSEHKEPYDHDVGIVHESAPLARDLKGRHMQMIAIGMSRAHGEAV